jgi:hypothetical protein
MGLGIIAGEAGIVGNAIIMPILSLYRWGKHRFFELFPLLLQQLLTQHLFSIDTKTTTQPPCANLTPQFLYVTCKNEMATPHYAQHLPNASSNSL